MQIPELRLKSPPKHISPSSQVPSIPYKPPHGSSTCFAHSLQHLKTKCLIVKLIKCVWISVGFYVWRFISVDLSDIGNVLFIGMMLSNCNSI